MCHVINRVGNTAHNIRYNRISTRSSWRREMYWALASIKTSKSNSTINYKYLTNENDFSYVNIPIIHLFSNSTN